MTQVNPGSPRVPVQNATLSLSQRVPEQSQSVQSQAPVNPNEGLDVVDFGNTPTTDVASDAQQPAPAKFSFKNFWSGVGNFVLSGFKALGQGIRGLVDGFKAATNAVVEGFKAEDKPSAYVPPKSEGK